MPVFPFGNYERVIIHDNWKAIERFTGTFAGRVQKHVLDRHILYYLNLGGRDISLFATGLGSAQTNWLVENLKSVNCRTIVKIGTCSALQSNLKEGDVVVPAQALVDEGATQWRRVKRDHSYGKFNNDDAVREYIEAREYTEPDTSLAVKIRKKLSQYPRRDCGECVWSVDAYDCFDASRELCRRIDAKQYQVRKFLSSGDNRPSDIMIAGVEMECSALFSSSTALGISAAAVIIISRTRNFLLYQWPPRDTARAQAVECQCIQDVVSFLASQDDPES
jgi:uridine phosphorylase